MAIIPQTNIFDNTPELDFLGDLERVKLILDNIDDRKILWAIRKSKHNNGRRDNSLEVMMNIYWAKIILQHPTMSSMLRELNRNSQLRKICGINNEKVPSSHAMSRFSIKLKNQKFNMKELFLSLRDTLIAEIPDFGQNQGVDGKYIDSFATGENKKKKTDGRRDTDAKYGVKEKHIKALNGTTKINKEIHFGYRVHLMADTKYELPTDYTVTTANISEKTELKVMLQKTHNQEILKRCNFFSADKGYDSINILETLEELNIKPIIDKRCMIKEEIQFKGNVYYNDMGEVFCYCNASGEKRSMAFDGYDKQRDTLGYKCPAKAYGIECKGKEQCNINTKIRIKRNINKRIFTEVARSSYKWKDYYNKRTAIERINSRIDNGYMFEKHTIRGIDKMETAVGMAFCIMLTIAIVNNRLGKQEKMRSLVSCA